MVTTSAQALNEFFAKVSQIGNGKEKFLSVAVTVLKLEGTDAQVRALAYIHDLLTRIKSDIDNLPFDADTKRQAYSYLNPFSGLLTFTEFHLDMQSAKGNFLSPQNLVGLTNLHMALWGNVRTIVPSKECYEIASEIREYILEIQTLNLPVHVKRALQKRLEQCASMLENFFFYGGETIKDELEALAGTIAFNSGGLEPSEQGFFKKAAKSVTQAMKFLAATDSTLGVVVGIAKKSEDILKLFDKSGN